MALPGVLRVPEFRRFWLASLASNAGSWLQVVGAGWLIYDLTHSPAAVGALALVARGPAFVLSAYAGQLADRLDRRRIGIVTFALQAVGAVLLAVLTALDLATPAVIYLATFLVGVGFALGLPAMLALVGVLAGRERLPEAIALNAAGINVARLAGPTLGGLMLVIGGPTACFAVNAASFLVLIVVLVGLPSFPPAAPGSRARFSEAFGYAKREPAPRRLLLGMAIFAALAAPAQELAPVVAANLGHPDVGLGLLLGFMGAGALVGAWLLEYLGRGGYPRHHALPTATVAFAAGDGGARRLAAGSGSRWSPCSSPASSGSGCSSPRTRRSSSARRRSSSAGCSASTSSPSSGRSRSARRPRAGSPSWWGSGGASRSCAALLGAWGLWSLVHRVPQIDGIEGAPHGGVREGLLARRHRRSRNEPLEPSPPVASRLPDRH